MAVEHVELSDVRRQTWSGHGNVRVWVGRLARVGCLAVMLLFAAVITLYVWQTEPKRVRAMAENFLSRLVDADITIGEARLSLFEGLQLDHVTIATKADASLPGVNRDVLRAKRLQISYSPRMLFTGEIDSARILAIEPEVYLVEDVTTGKWNVQSLERPREEPRPASRPTTRPRSLDRLPQVILRGGRVYRGQIVDGRYERLQSVLLDGQLLPRADAGAYRFNIQTRTDRGLAGPALQGQVSLVDGSVESSLRNVRLDFIEPLMPARVRTFWQKLSPGGRVDVPVLNGSRRADGRDGFRIELELAGVTMSIRPTDWTSSGERRLLSDPDGVARELARLPGSLPIATAVRMQPALRAGTIPLDDVNGRFVFTEDGVTLDGLRASLDGNQIVIRGRLGGYNVDAPIELHVASPPGRPLRLRPTVPYINALPAEIREVYYRFRPTGQSTLDVSIARDAHGGRPKVSGELGFQRAAFTFEAFPFPVQNASGRLIVDDDPALGETRLRIDDVRGNGPAGGPNARGELSVDGVITPLLGYAMVDVKVRGTDVHNEPALVAALPTPARDVVHAFDDDGSGPRPTFAGDFLCHVHREPGPISHWTYDTDVAIRDAAGTFQGFKLPLEQMAATLEIRKDHVAIKHAAARHGDATIFVDGLTEWGEAVNPNRKVGEPGVRTRLTLAARKVSVDDALRSALPAEVGEVLRRFGVGGTFDLDGPLVVDDPRRPPSFDFAIRTLDGRFAPVDWRTSIDHLDAVVRVTPTSLHVDRASGDRDGSPVTATGHVDYAGPPTLAVDVDARRVKLDRPLFDSLPTDAARAVWTSLTPSGVTDATLSLSGPAASPAWRLGLVPHDAAATPDFLPLAMTKINGEIRATDARVELDKVTANVAGGSARVSGAGDVGDRSTWSLRLDTTGTVVDGAFRDALPKAMGDVLDDNAVNGRADLHFDQLDWTSAPSGAIDVVFDARAKVADASWSAGLNVDRATGTLALKGHFVDDAPVALDGSATFGALRISGVDATDGSATVASTDNGRRVRLGDIHARLGEGEVAGDLSIDRSRRQLTKWSANFLLRNADVAALAGHANDAKGDAKGDDRPDERAAAAVADLRGELNASLAIEGGWNNDPANAAAAANLARRGRGDISVSGDRMLKVPMVLGVTQIVSLSLPFTGGFNQATASYSLDGDRVAFDDITLQSPEMKIKGNGWLDLGERQVSLDFYTASAGRQLPVIGKLLDAARKELFQLKVRGTLSAPEVKAGSMQTITTTVDEILGGEKK